MADREYTVGELIEELKKVPLTTKVHLRDADTGWTIPKFSVSYDQTADVLWFNPCEYGDMIS